MDVCGEDVTLWSCLGVVMTGTSARVDDVVESFGGGALVAGGLAGCLCGGVIVALCRRSVVMMVLCGG